MNRHIYLSDMFHTSRDAFSLIAKSGSKRNHIAWMKFDFYLHACKKITISLWGKDESDTEIWVARVNSSTQSAIKVSSAQLIWALCTVLKHGTLPRPLHGWKTYALAQYVCSSTCIHCGQYNITKYHPCPLLSLQKSIAVLHNC